MNAKKKEISRWSRKESIIRYQKAKYQENLEVQLVYKKCRYHGNPESKVIHQENPEKQIEYEKKEITSRSSITIRI